MARILIVDDSLFMRNHLSKLLAKNGYDTILAENGKVAVDTYRRDRPDAVLMDITMPEMNGLEALKEICRADPQAKVVMLTALGQESMVVQAIQAGARDYVVKPFDPDRVTAALHKVMG